LKISASPSWLVVHMAVQIVVCFGEGGIPIPNRVMMSTPINTSTVKSGITPNCWVAFTYPILIGILYQASTEVSALFASRIGMPVPCGR